MKTTVNAMIQAAVAGNFPTVEEITEMAYPIYRFSPRIAGMDSPEELAMYQRLLVIAAPIARKEEENAVQRGLAEQAAWMARFKDPE